MVVLTVRHHLLSQPLFMKDKKKRFFQKAKIVFMHLGFVFHILMTSNFTGQEIRECHKFDTYVFRYQKIFSLPFSNPPSCIPFLPPFLPSSFGPFFFRLTKDCLLNESRVSRYGDFFPPKQNRIIHTIIIFILVSVWTFIKFLPFTCYIVIYKAVNFFSICEETVTQALILQSGTNFKEKINTMNILRFLLLFSVKEMSTFTKVIN